MSWLETRRVILVRKLFESVDVLEWQLYSDMIFPLIAASDGERARNLPQVCTSWRACFALTKVNWDLFAVTQPIKDFSKLCNVMAGAYRLRSLQLVCEEGAGAVSTHKIRTVLAQLSRLQCLSLIAPGGALTTAAMHALPTSITDLRIETAPELDLSVSEVICVGEEGREKYCVHNRESERELDRKTVLEWDFAVSLVM